MKYSINQLVKYNGKTVLVKEVSKIGPTYAYALSNGEVCFEKSLSNVPLRQYKNYLTNKIKDNFDEILDFCFSHS